MTLHLLVAQDSWQEFDKAWKERMTSEDSIQDLVIALHIAGEHKRIARCLPMVREHVQLLEADDRASDAARLIGAVLLAGGNPGELDAELLRLSEKAWGQEPWWSSPHRHLEPGRDAP
jgi:hypothetical protein